MRLEITIGPPLLTVNQGHTVLACEPDGQIHDGTDKGLFFFDTRIMSVYDHDGERRAVQIAECGIPLLLRVAFDAHQQRGGNRGRNDSARRLERDAEPLDRCRPARRHRHRELRRTESAVQSGDRDPQRFRGFVRSQGRTHRAPWPRRDRVGRRFRNAAHRLRQWSFPPRDRRQGVPIGQPVQLRQRPAHVRSRDRARPQLAHLPRVCPGRRRAPLRAAERLLRPRGRHPPRAGISWIGGPPS